MPGRGCRDPRQPDQRQSPRAIRVGDRVTVEFEVTDVQTTDSGLRLLSLRTVSEVGVRDKYHATTVMEAGVCRLVRGDCGGECCDR